MLKTLIFFLLSPFIFAQSISSINSQVKLSKPFVLKSSENIFDNSLYYTHKALLNCNPKLSAVYKVEAANKLKVLPKETLQSNTNYTCSYKNKSFTFKTEALQVNEALYFKHEKILRLSFNDEIDANSISKGIQLKKLDKLSSTKLKYKVIDQGERSLVLKILEKVGKSTIELTVDKNLKTKHASTLNETFNQIFNIQNSRLTLDPDKKKLTI
jgi:hypothetical protein